MLIDIQVSSIELGNPTIAQMKLFKTQLYLAITDQYPDEFIRIGHTDKEKTEIAQAYGQGASEQFVERGQIILMAAQIIHSTLKNFGTWRQIGVV
jgi:hypothetical protein